ncbi:MAG TPA: hypothetical protein VK824_06585, partial [Planctomycetota bacterium]|nr:hypothetical protein [Planctomycetota bacterium]
MTQNSRGLAAGLRPGRGARGTLEGRTLASARLRRSLAAALAALAAALPGACGDVGGSSDPRPGDLLVADIDAGAAQPDGERLGVIFRARPEGDGYKLSTFAEDPRWREPADVLVLPDRCVLVLDQQWKPDDGPARGAIFKTYWAGGPVTLLWSDTRARQLVAMAWSAREHLLYVSDREANPSELRDAAGAPANTGCVFAIPLTSDDTAGDATIAAAGPELVTPGALTVLHDGRVLLMDADANPHHALLADGRAATPGELFELKDGKLLPLLVPDVTVSPIALIER